MIGAGESEAHANPDAAQAVDQGGGQWDLILEPHSSLWALHLDDLWRYRDLVFLFVRRDFVAQFKQTILGPTWFVIKPLLSSVVFAVVFGNIAGLSTDGLPKLIFYFSGNILWQYFSDCLTRISNTFVTNAHLFGKVYFPRLAVPVSVVISGLMRLGLQMLFFAAFWVYFVSTGSAISLSQAAFVFPLLVAIMSALSLGLGIIFSSLTTKYRDLRFLLEFGVRLLMYGTPVIFPLSAIPGKWRWLMLANPITPVIETFRLGFLGVGSLNWLHLSYSAAFALVALLIGIVMFNHVERTFMDTV